ncbi:N-acetylmuramoyl-L-alanine amidase [Chengkuizengella sp. SCS-71B]|uniref:N-acetylmuramoyl-L-alanine amidase n=1 Tax=Chengkuizengella sp. SCS-71B TaxID=3115290 RepID=UPI0032C222B1
MIVNNYLTPNPFSRPGTKLKKIKGVVIHWVANKKSTAEANRKFFENRKNEKNGYGSAHEIIDLNGDVIVCIPKDEIAYHVGSSTYTKEALERLSNYPNDCTYGIECTHVDWEGKMTKETYNSLVNRCVELCKEFDLNPLTDLWLHKEVVGWKDCHKWFVNNPNEWDEFMKEVDKRMKNELKTVNIDLVKGDEKQTVQGFLVDGKTYIELRETGEFLDAQVGWDNIEKRASLIKKGEN